MSVVAHRPGSWTNSDLTVELVCSSGHRTTYSLARAVRLNDGWCGQCGADVSYKAPAEAAKAA